MQYMLLLYGVELEAGAAECEREALAAELVASGSHRASHTLEHTACATTVRRRGGRTLLSDGPFAETREQLLGLLLVEAQNLDDAIAIAERAPDARLGAVEIRPVRGTP